MSSQKNNKNHGSKRPRTESLPPTPEIPVYDRYYKINMEEGSFKNTSPFILHRALLSQIGTLEETRKLADGSLLIKVSNENQSRKVSEMVQLMEKEVKVTPHKTLNIIKGIITCKDLANCSDKEVLENLESQGVSEVFRIPSRNNSDIPSHTFILSFKLHQLPSRIYAGWYSLRVRQYIQNPMRCYNCQRFGHTASKCTHDPLCPSCGLAQHADSPCSKNQSCINCGGTHSPRYKGCPTFKREFEIQKLRATDNLNYFEAKRKYLSQNPSFSISYSSVTKNIKPAQSTVSTQCDLSITEPLSNLTSFYPSQNLPRPTLSIPTKPSDPPLNPPSPINPLTTSSKSFPTSSLPQSKPPHHPSPSFQLNPPSNPTTSNQTNKQTTKSSTISKIIPNKSIPSRSNVPSADTNKKKPTRSNKSTPNSSSESILELSPDITMDDPPQSKYNSSKKKK